MPEVAEYKVQLDNYYGPLDLLLHLVKETEVDITAIALARACEQYISFLTAMERRDIDLSGNFLTLASQLLLIKSRTIAPPELTPAPGEEEEEEEGDASLELIRKLLDYKRFKDRARGLDERMAERAQKYGRPRIKIEGETEQEPLRNLELWDLVLLYSKALKGTRLDALMSILYRDVPLEIFIDRILNTLTQKKTTSLSELLGESPDRTSILGTFLALLQLAKGQKVSVTQEVVFGDIQVRAIDEPPPEPVEAESPTQAAPTAETSAPPPADSSTFGEPNLPAPAPEKPPVA
ncbi:MAG TPA: segregation/condensation protein A [Planctomycetota bacterium]|nr:segregation/condensation protein A [Planctomycetota bacterium]